jgi:two-component SAPR family response regulator
MKFLIIEDEALAVQNLKTILQETEPDASIVGVCHSVRELVNWLKNNTTELILLDIHLSDGLSFKIFEQITVTTTIILTTAYDQFGIKAFELNSIDYLIKPIKVADMQRALTKFKTLNQTQSVDYQRLIEILSKRELSIVNGFL